VRREEPNFKYHMIRPATLSSLVAWRSGPCHTLVIDLEAIETKRKTEILLFRPEVVCGTEPSNCVSGFADEVCVHGGACQRRGACVEPPPEPS